MSKLSKKELLLAADMLDLLGEELASNACNDWDFPESWTKAERMVFVRQYHEWNGDPEEYDPDFLSLPDFAVADFLASKARGE